MSTHDNSDLNIQELRTGLNQLGDVIERLAGWTPEPRPIRDRELSGNKINGGQIINFSSTGIKDEAKNTVLVVRNDGIHLDQATIKRLNSEVSVGGDLDVEGEVRARRLHVDEITTDSRLERSTSLEFRSDDKKSVVGKGLQWLTDENTKQLVLRKNPYRLWSSESIDVHRGQSYYINGEQVLSESTLGPTITHSSLQKVGTLRGLTVMGNFNVDQFVYWDSSAMRLGIGTDAPNAMLSITSLESEFIVDPDDENVRVGTWTNDGVELITDNTTRISVSKNGNVTIGTKGSSDTKVSVHGRLGVGVSNPESDVSITTSGPVRFEDKKFEVGSEVPRKGSYSIGDIVWNNKPKPTGYVGWVCVREGTPGMWKPFGQIGS